MKNVFHRIGECLLCEYFNKCLDEIDDPQDYPNGTCKQKDIFRESEVSDENNI